MTAPTPDERERLARILAPDAWNLSEAEWFEEHGDGAHGPSWHGGHQARARKHSLGRADVILAAGYRLAPAVEWVPNEVEESARAEVHRRHPEWHDRGVGIVQGSHFREGFVKGALWQASRRPEQGEQS